MYGSSSKELLLNTGILSASQNNILYNGQPLAKIQVTGSSFIGYANLTGIGGTQVIYSGNSILISGSVPKEIGFACSDETTALTIGSGKVQMVMPYSMSLTGVLCSVTTAPSGSTLIVDINNNGVSVFSTQPTIDSIEFATLTAATPAVITGSSLLLGSTIRVDIDQVGASIAGAGLKVWMLGLKQ